MIIYNTDGQGATINIEVDDRSYRYRKIMGDDKMFIYFAVTDFVEISIGAYVDFEGRRYTLNQPANFKKLNSREYQYTLQFDGEKGSLAKYRIRDRAEKLLKFPLMAKPQQHLQLIVDNLNDREGGWSVGNCIDAPVKLVSYNHTTLAEALQLVAEAFETEFQVVNKTIHLGRVEYNKTTPLALSYGKGNGFKPGVGRANQDDSSAIEILHVQGGDRNINRSEYNSPTLLLPAGQTITYEGKEYIVSDDGHSVFRNDKPQSTGMEGSVDLSHIYPSREGEVSELITVDAEKHLYDFKDFTIPESLDFNDCLMEGETLTVVFQSGMLAGKEFEIDSYVHADRLFRLVYNEEDGLVLPGGQFLPQPGDTYAVFGIQLPDAYVRDDVTESGASWDLLREAVRYLHENENPRFSFKGSLDGIWAKSDWLNIGGKIVLGGYVNFSDTRFQPDGVLVRIIGIKDFINNPWSPEIELSNNTVGGSFMSKIGQIKANEVVNDELHRQAISFTKRRYRETIETVEMLQGAVSGFSEGVSPLSVQTMSLIVGSEALQFRFVDSKTTPSQVLHEVTFDGSNKIMSAPGGIIQHMTIGITTLQSGGREVDEYSFWDVTAFDSPPLTDPAKKYYLYIKASKADSTATFFLSESPIKMEEVSGYYHFLVGFLNSETDGERSFARMHGFTEVLPGRVTTSKIHADTVEATKVLAESIYATGAEISGTLLVEGSINAEKIDVTGLFAKEIVATNMNVAFGRVGGFEIDNVLKSEDSQGRGILIDPADFKISIENKSEGTGISAVNMRAGALTPYLDLTKGTGGIYSSSVDSAPYSVSRTSNQLREPGGQDFSVYLGKISSTTGLASSSVPVDTNKIDLTADKNYAVDLRYLFAIQHNGGSHDGKTHKIHGDLTVRVNSSLIGVTGSGQTKTLVSSKTDYINISRSNQVLYDEYGLTRKVSFNSDDCVYAYWKLDVNLSGDLTYQEWQDDFWSNYWSTEKSWVIEFQSKMGALSSFYPSIGVTELTTSGFQSVWATNRYFRIDGNDQDTFIRSAGVWRHNGYEIATVNDVQQAVPDLSAYVLATDLQNSYYDKNYIDANFANIDGNAAQDFNVKDLIIHGKVNHWLEDVITVDDASLQLNAKQDGIRVNSGLIIYDNDSASELSKLYYSTANEWQIDGNKIWHSGNDGAGSGLDADKLDGLGSSVFFRKFGSGTYDLNTVLNSGAYKVSLGSTNVPGKLHGQLLVVYGGSDTSFQMYAEYENHDIFWRGDSGAPASITNPWNKFWHSGNDGAGSGLDADKLDGLDSSQFLRSDVNDYTSGWLAVGKSTFPTEALDVNGNGKFSGKGLFGSDISDTSTFVSGFAGSGWKLEKATNHLTVDNLTVRNQMDVYELVINKIRAINGSLWVSDAMKVNSVSKYSEYIFRLFIDNDGGNKQIPFVVGDIIKAQKFDGRNVISITGRVQYYDPNGYRVNIDTQGYSNWNGDYNDLKGLEFVRIGNVSNTSRQGAIYLTSSDSGAPYIDVLDGVNSADYSGNNRLRIGKLDGISSQNGYGIWGSRNGSDTDFVISSDGYAKIAGWNFDNTKLYQNLGVISVGLGVDSDSSAWKGLELRKDINNRLNIHSNGTDFELFTRVAGDILFQLGSLGNQIAGVNFDNSRLWTNNWELNKDGSANFAQNKINFLADGSAKIAGVNFDNSRLWTTNWELKADGTATFTKGNIGGFTINDSLLSGENITLGSSGTISLKDSASIYFSKGSQINYITPGTSSLWGDGRDKGVSFVSFPYNYTSTNSFERAQIGMYDGSLSANDDDTFIMLKGKVAIQGRRCKVVTSIIGGGTIRENEILITDSSFTFLSPSSIRSGYGYYADGKEITIINTSASNKTITYTNQDTQNSKYFTAIANSAIKLVYYNMDWYQIK